MTHQLTSPLNTEGEALLLLSSAFRGIRMTHQLTSCSSTEGEEFLLQIRAAQLCTREGLKQQTILQHFNCQVFLKFGQESAICQVAQQPEINRQLLFKFGQESGVTSGSINWQTGQETAIKLASFLRIQSEIRIVYHM